ncbi:MAG: QueT transporter family protein [Ruminococcaceae bacterium]|nr:QueT transporter family protein [Oscillospiraceae bacterium]
MYSLKNPAKHLTQAAAIAAIYIILSFVFQPISFGAVQCRIPELLTVLPVFTPAAVPGLFAGCLLSNLLMGGALPADIVFGSLATLIAAFLTRKLRKNKLIALIPPVVVNAVVVGTYLHQLVSPEISLWVNMGLVFLGQLGSCYLLGYPLSLLLERYRGQLFGQEK